MQQMCHALLLLLIGYLSQRKRLITYDRVNYSRKLNDIACRRFRVNETVSVNESHCGRLSSPYSLEFRAAMDSLQQPTAHYHRSQQQELASVLVLVGGDGQDARAIHGSSRSAMVHPSAFVLNGPRLVVVATLG